MSLRSHIYKILHRQYRRLYGRMLATQRAIEVGMFVPLRHYSLEPLESRLLLSVYRLTVPPKRVVTNVVDGDVTSQGCSA